MAFVKSGSPGGTRTPDQLVNSQLLYRLSYRGMIDFSIRPRRTISALPCLVASCSNDSKKRTDHFISIGIQQIPGSDHPESGKIRVWRGFAALNPLTETTLVADYLVPAAFSGDELRASRSGDNWHTKKNAPELKRRILGRLL